MDRQLVLPSPEDPNFQFLKCVHSKHLDCKICFNLMLHPVRLHKCGHTFCTNCVEEKNVKQCPICLQKIIAKQKDILASKLVGELPVKCTNPGCPWKGTLEQFKNFHKASCKLKDRGIDGWLKQLQNTIQQNSIGIGAIIENNEQSTNKQKTDKKDKNQIDDINERSQNKNKKEQESNIKQSELNQNKISLKDEAHFEDEINRYSQIEIKKKLRKLND